MKKLKKQFTVLFVEDEPYIRDLISQLLTEQNVRVIALPDPTNQIDVMLKEKNNLDLVISGIMMPHIDGIAMIKKVKAIPELKDIPWVFCSNLSGQVFRDEAVRLGANLFYPKQDYTPDQLVQKIMYVLHHPAN